jgi:hypothetical protein
MVFMCGVVSTTLVSRAARIVMSVGGAPQEKIPVCDVAAFEFDIGCPI